MLVSAACLVSLALATSMNDGVGLVAPEGNAVVVLPDVVELITEYAAQELVEHVRLATGATLEVKHEGECASATGPRVYLGPTQAASEAGIDVAGLPEEAFVLRTADHALIIAAEQGPGDPLSEGTLKSGVLWGVYEVLERELGVRWLWPGALGTFVPKQAQAQVGPYDEVVPPRFQQRHLRPGLGPQGFAKADPRLAFSEAQRAQYAQDQSVFLRRHRMGRSANTYFTERSFQSGHAFGGWWERYGAEHPEWFQLLPDGRRGPENLEKPDNVSMCVSNPELQQKLVDLWAEERAKHPDEPLNIGVGENDTAGACLCEHCLAWDGPEPDLKHLPKGLERSYLPVQAGSRYARFAEAVRARAANIDPDVKVHFYAYYNYFWAPEEGVELDPNVVIGFVPWFRWAGWFPRTASEQAWIKDQWLGWQRAGASAYYRPNWFLDGYAMPQVYMHQFADAFQFYAAHGMMGTDFDSLQGMWSAQGPNLYLLARIHVRPETNVDELLDEYYAAFGPAADAVRAYFDHWEQYSIDHSSRAAKAIKKRAEGRFRRYALYAQVADELYPPKVFDAGFALLDQAAAAASGDTDPVYADRVAYLRAGLEHAKRCIDTAKVVNNRRSSPDDRAAALASLRDYRRSVEHLEIANMDRAAIIETDSWDEVPGFKGPWPGEELFRDGALEHGLHLSAPLSTARPIEIGTVLAQAANGEPQWRLAQWGTRFNLIGAKEQRRARGVRVLANEGKEVRVYPGGVAGEGVWLEVRGGAEYDGQLRKQGEAWPHLLIEQSFPDAIRLSDFDALRFQMDFRIDHAASAVSEALDSGLHTAMITAFFTVHNMDPASTDYRDMIWFGIPVFDARYEIPHGHQALDTGKDDATGKFICTLEGSRFWKSPTGDGAWHALDENLLPLIQDALAASQGHGYLTASEMKDLVITSFNLGWEVPGPYDCAAQVRGLHLEGQPKSAP